MINDIYMQILFIEFCDAVGINIYKGNFNYQAQLKKHETEFKDWIKLLHEIKEEYAKNLLSIKNDSRLMAELGKGKHETIVPNLVSNGQNAIAITLFADTLESAAIIKYNGKIAYLDDGPIIRYTDPKYQLESANINPEFNTDIDTLLYQLPDFSNRVNVDALVASSRAYNDILIGAFGNTSDKDYRRKLITLKKLKSQIEFNSGVSCQFEILEQNGIYLTYLLSEQMEMEKRLTYHR